MDIYNDIEKKFEEIKNERKLMKNEEFTKICVRIPKNLLIQLKINKLRAESKNKSISLQDQIVAALNLYLKKI